MKGFPGRQKILLFAEKIEIFDLMNSGPLQVKGPGRAHQDMDFVTQFDQFVGEVGKIDSLSSAVRVAAITQETDFHKYLPIGKNAAHSAGWRQPHFGAILF